MKASAGRLMAARVIAATLLICASLAVAAAESSVRLRSVVSAPGVPLARVEASGCWVRFHDGERHQGDELMLVGPLQLARLSRVGAGWRDWNSAIVGPRARVEVFEAEGFAQPAATLRPGQVVAEMASQNVGRFKDIESVRVSCDAQ